MRDRRFRGTLLGHGRPRTDRSRRWYRRPSRGRYALPAIDQGLREAHRLTGVAWHQSAALLHGWAVKTVPSRPHVTVPKNRQVTDDQRVRVVLHRATLAPGEVTVGVTSVQRTLVDCLRYLDFDEALSIADSALRNHSISKEALAAPADGIRGPLGASPYSRTLWTRTGAWCWRPTRSPGTGTDAHSATTHGVTTIW